MPETQIIEFKETVTNTFLKTVSPFANYYGGTIFLGMDDRVEVVLQGSLPSGLTEWE